MTAVMQCRKSGSEVRRPQPIATESAKLAKMFTEPALRKITRPPGVHRSTRPVDPDAASASRRAGLLGRCEWAGRWVRVASLCCI